MRRVVSFSLLPNSHRVDKVADQPAYIAPSARPIKSCMSVTNLSDSLRNEGLARGGNDSFRMSARQLKSSPNLCLLDDGGANLPPTLKRNVSFHKVEVRNYDVTVGDNPAVTTGPPVSLDWTYFPEHEVKHVEEYEAERAMRKKKDELRIGRAEREARLKAEGYTEVDMIRAIHEAEEAQKRRNETVRTLHAMEGELLVENMSRKIKRIVTLSSEKKEQKRLWKKAEKFAKKQSKAGRRSKSKSSEMTSDGTTMPDVSEASNGSRRVSDISDSSSSLGIDQGTHSPSPTSVCLDVIPSASSFGSLAEEELPHVDNVSDEYDSDDGITF